ncbi:MAG TPA: helix-hairpin-helix domain-containing protein [Thermoanaerobaculia bacterium]|nr:helix-hairpin-helix domain-containing protein [Thermoanaerobaculia bacterium]
MNVRRKTSTAILALAFLLALAPERATAASKSKVDINSASQAELEALPGVGATTARKIIGGRPYRTVGDLSKAGVSASTIQKISGLVTVGRAPAASAPAPVREPRPKVDAPESRTKASPSSRAAPGGSSSSSSSLVDLNRASQKELEALPGVGAVTARKIIAGRPYSSVGDLSSAGVSASTIGKISPLVTVSAASGARSSRPAPAPASAPASASSSAPAPASRASEAPAAQPARERSAPSSAPSSEYQAPPASGMVWVNLDSKIFHREGDRWYGRTKNGKYMSEADAVKAGYRLSREKGEPGAR